MKEKKIIIAPSLLAANFACLEKDIQLVEQGGADWFHVDIMDGRYAPNISFGPKIVKTVNSITDIFLDVHLMIENPERYIDVFVDAGADLITVHLEACVHLNNVLNYIHKKGVKAGISLNPGTPIHFLEEVIDLPEMILIMSVNPGFGGQKFIPGSLEKIRKLKQYLNEKSLDTLIEVDGGVDFSNVESISNAGCNVIVSGVTIFKHDTPADAVIKLRDLAEKGLK